MKDNNLIAKLAEDAVATAWLTKRFDIKPGSLQYALAAAAIAENADKIEALKWAAFKKAKAH